MKLTFVAFVILGISGVFVSDKPRFCDISLETSLRDVSNDMSQYRFVSDRRRSKTKVCNTNDIVVRCLIRLVPGVLLIKHPNPLPDYDIELELEALDAADDTTSSPITQITISVPASNGTSDSTTVPIITVQTVTPDNMTTEASPGTIEPITNTIEPITFTETPATISTQSTPNSTMTTPSKTTAKPSTPAKDSGFDGGAFGGGIATGVGISIILLVAWRCYVMRKSSKGYNTM